MEETNGDRCFGVANRSVVSIEVTAVECVGLLTHPS